MAIELRTCQHKDCGAEMYGSKNRKYCSDRCRKAAQRLRERRNNETTIDRDSETKEDSI